MNKQYRNMIILCCGLIAASLGIINNCVGVFISVVSEDLNILRGSYALCSTICLVFQSFTAFIIPSVMKRYNYRNVLRIASLGAAVCLLLISLCRSLPLFYLLWALTGICAGFFNTIPITMIIGNWFHKKGATLIGVTLSFSGIAGAIGSKFLAAVISSAGWRTAYCIMAALVVIFSLPALLMKYAVRPQDMGLVPYGDEEPARGAGMSGKTAPASSHAAEMRFLQAGFILLVIFVSGNALVSGTPQHLSGYAVTLGYTEAFGATLISSAMIGNIVSKLALGSLGDRIGPVNSILTMIAITVGALVLILMGGSLPGFVLVLAAFMLGFGYALVSVGSPMLTRYLYGNENYDKAFSVVGFAINFAGAFALTIIGYIYDFFGDYRIAFIGDIVILILGTAILMYLRGQRKYNA